MQVEEVYDQKLEVHWNAELMKSRDPLVGPSLLYTVKEEVHIHNGQAAVLSCSVKFTLHCEYLKFTSP